LHYYSPESLGQDTPHFSIETIGKETIHTDQRIIDASYNTTMVHTTDLPSPTLSHTFEVPNIVKAQKTQKSMVGSNLGIYDYRNNSCLTNAADVLRAGGTDIPASNVQLRKFIKEIFGGGNK